MTPEAVGRLLKPRLRKSFLLLLYPERLVSLIIPVQCKRSSVKNVIIIVLDYFLPWTGYSIVTYIPGLRLSHRAFLVGLQPQIYIPGRRVDGWGKPLGKPRHLISSTDLNGDIAWSWWIYLTLAGRKTEWFILNQEPKISVCLQSLFQQHGCLYLELKVAFHTNMCPSK